MRLTNILLKYQFPPLPTKQELIKLSQSLTVLKKPRAFLNSQYEADRLLSLLGEGSFKGRTVLELKPGPAIFTRSLLDDGAKTIVPLEPSKELEQITGVPFFYEHSDFRSDNTTMSLMFDVPIENRIKFIREKYDWSEIHPTLAMTSFSSSINESYHFCYLMSELIYNQQGWFSQGRIPVYMIVSPEVMKGFLSASPIGFALQAVGEVENFIDISPDKLYPKRTVQLIKFVPFEKPKIKSEFTTFFYIVNKLMVRKNQSVKASLGAIAPGLNIIDKDLNFDTKTLCKHLSLNDADNITLNYIKWYRNRFDKDPIHID